MVAVQVLRLALVTETTEQELRGITKLSRCNLNKVCSLYELRFNQRLTHPKLTNIVLLF